MDIKYFLDEGFNNLSEDQMVSLKRACEKGLSYDQLKILANSCASPARIDSLAEAMLKRVEMEKVIQCIEPSLTEVQANLILNGVWD